MYLYKTWILGMYIYIHRLNRILKNQAPCPRKRPDLDTTQATDIVQSSMGLHMHGDKTQRNFTLLKHRKISSLKPFTEMTNKLGTKRTVCQIFFCKVYKSYCF